MEVLDNLLSFISPYSTQIATLCAMAVGILIAALASEFYARKTQLPATSTRDFDGSVFMKLQQIQLFSIGEPLDLQITTYINGMEFHYPSSDKSKWISTAQKMSDITIELPDAELYRIHLAVHLRSGETLEGSPATVRRAMLQPPPALAEPSSLPASQDKVIFSEEYKLYYLEDGLRNISIKAMIPYEIYIQ